MTVEHGLPTEATRDISLWIRGQAISRFGPKANWNFRNSARRNVILRSLFAAIFSLRAE